MTMKNKSKCSVPALAALLSLLLPAAASAFELRPMSHTFEPSGSGVNRVFEVHNDLDEEVAVTLTVKTRSVDAEGVETLKDTKDFAIFPTEMLLKGKAAQVVRVRWQGAASLPSERAYRIIAEEVSLKRSKAVSKGKAMGIKLVLRFGGTIYVAPDDAKADVVVASAKAVNTAKGPVLEIVLQNRGGRHALIDQPSLTVTSGKTTGHVLAAELEKALAGENILAGSTRRLSLPWPKDLPAGPVEAKLNASFLR
jgi:fimbrial chaperone protein